MQAFPLGSSNVAQTALVGVITLAAVSLLGLVLAYWTWVWFAPRAEPRVEAPSAQSGSIATAADLFGTQPRNPKGAAATGLAIRLLGVVAAARGRAGYAVVQLEGKDILAVHEGEDVAPGVRLAEVLPDHVMLERGGVRESLAWPEKRATGPGAPPAVGAATTAVNK